METLPAGFSYEGSDLSKAAVKVEGQTVAFTLLGDARFTYTVAAPSAEGVYSFSGVLLDANRAEQAVGGDSSIRVGTAPTPTPTPEPTATPTPEPTATPTPQPSHADPAAHGHADGHADARAHGHADPGADSHPTPEPAPTATPTPTAAPEPTPTAAPPPPPSAPEPEEGLPIGLIALIGAGAVLAIVAVIAYVRRRRR